jgi:protein-L-isoaspartate(D-aspartate) O-methyltransferase
VDATIQSYTERLYKDLMQIDYVWSDPDWLKQALFNVPRHFFIEQYHDNDEPGGIVQVKSPPTSKQLAKIYSDTGLMIRKMPHSAASQPSLIFAMLADLELTRGLKVLEVGTGSGWNAGLIAFGVEDDRLVYSIDLQADLVEKARKHLSSVGLNHVNLRVSDGGFGWTGEIFDRIIVTVGSPDIPPTWVQSLADGGILVMPLKTRGVGDPILRLQRQGDRLTGKLTLWAGFMSLQGDFRSPTEDRLEPPWDSVIEELLREKPTTVSIPEILGTDCAFWLRLKGEPIQILGEYKGQRGFYPVLLDRELPALYVPLSGYAPKPEKRMDIYGNQQLVGRFIEGIEEWINLGKPRIIDYYVELVDPTELDDVVSHRYIDKRPNATLRFSLADESILV